MGENYNLSEEAQNELYRIICYFQLLDNEDVFFEDLIRQLNLIKKMPYSFQVRYRDIRIITLDRFNYSIHYRIIDESIWVIHILNQKQNF
jgi:hypothetical protein